MTAALEGGEWSAARPFRTLPPGKNRYPFYRRLGGPQGRSERAENLVPTGIRSRTFQPVVSRYTDWATGPRWWCKYGHYIRIIDRQVISEEGAFLLLSKGDLRAETVREVIAAQDQGLQT